jgi:hypothetical protein
LEWGSQLPQEMENKNFSRRRFGKFKTCRNPYLGLDFPMHVNIISYNQFCDPVPLKGPKHDQVESGFFAQIRPIWLGDLGTELNLVARILSVNQIYFRAYSV